jgi:hypothetical protein
MPAPRTNENGSRTESQNDTSQTLQWGELWAKQILHRHSPTDGRDSDHQRDAVEIFGNE